MEHWFYSLNAEERVRGDDFFFPDLKALQKYVSVLKKKKKLSCMRLFLKTNKGSTGALTVTDLGGVMNWTVCTAITHSLADTWKHNSQVTTDVSAYCSFAALFINKLSLPSIKCSKCSNLQKASSLSAKDKYDRLSEVLCKGVCV